jgi:hypothetical protein
MRVSLWIHWRICMHGVMHSACIIHQRCNVCLCIHACAAQACAARAWASGGWGAIYIQRRPRKSFFRPVNHYRLKRSIRTLCSPHTAYTAPTIA